MLVEKRRRVEARPHAIYMEVQSAKVGLVERLRG
jgi:hypothetical protein